MTNQTIEQKRVLHFNGIHNFRDVGGYVGADDRTVKWGVLFRSGNYAKATKRDVRKLEALGVTRVVDFRAEKEKQRDPSRLPVGLKGRVVELPMLDEANEEFSNELKERFENGKFDVDTFDFDGFFGYVLYAICDRIFWSVCSIF